MREQVSVHYKDELDKFVIYGGAPEGRDNVHRTVCSWPGWRRVPMSPAQRKRGNGCSRYEAPSYPASILAVSSDALIVRWAPSAVAERDGILRDVELAKGCLDGSYVPVPRGGYGASYPTPRVPMKHQAQALGALYHMGYRALIADDMGLGKTSVALWSAHEAGAKRLVILCPVSVKHNWRTEIEKTLGAEWYSIIIDGTPKKRASQFAEATNLVVEQEDHDCPIAVIINYDLLRYLTVEQLATLRGFAGGEFLICDESHYLKNKDSHRSKATAYVAGKAKHRLLLTGTPVRNLVDDLYNQAELIHPGTWTSWHDFAKRHLVVQQVDYSNAQRKMRPVMKVVAGKDLPGLNAVVNTFQIRRHKTDVLDLPPKIRTVVELEMDDATKRVYKAMKEHALYALDELSDTDTIFSPQAHSAMEAVMRCEQIAQGFVGGIPEPVMEKLSSTALKSAVKIDGRPHELAFPKSPKLAWMIENARNIVKQGGNPLIFSRFNAPLFYLHKHLTSYSAGNEPSSSLMSCDILHGGLASDEKFERVLDFQNGEFDTLLCQVKMAEGWNATVSQDVLFMGRDWSPAINAQAEDRTYRIGQTGTVNVQIPVMMDTIELPIHRRLAAKASAAESALKNVTIAELREML